MDAYWTQVQSGGYQNEGFILKSTGKTGNESLFIRVRQQTNVTNAIEFSMIEDYQPNNVQGLAGVVTNEGPKQPLYWSTSAYPTSAPVGFWLSFDKDKIMLALTGDKTIAGTFKNFLFIGLPERMYTPTSNPPLSAMIHAVSRFATTLGIANGDLSYALGKGLRDRARAAGPGYNMIFLNKWKSKGWGDNVLMSDIFLYHNDTEGLRAKMTGVKSLQVGNPIEYRDGDEITVGSKRYTIHNVFTVGTGTYPNCFPTGWLAVEQIQ
ncbi:hypothetical protein D3C76_722100 [compost metagenome]